MARKPETAARHLVQTYGDEAAGVARLYAMGHAPRSERRAYWMKISRMLARSNGAEDFLGRHIPETYLRGLTPEQRAARKRELTLSREGALGYSSLPTDLVARRKGLVREGRYTKEAKRRGIEHRGDFQETAHRAMEHYGVRASAAQIRQTAAALKRIFNKGLAAWQTGGHRPGASQHAWAYARVASVLTGGKSYWTADAKDVRDFPAALRRGIEKRPTWSSVR